MQTVFDRFEIKYPIQSKFIPAISAMLQNYGMRLDDYASLSPSHRYTVTSLYYESPEVSSYYDKSGGYLDRNKIRMRIYQPHLITGDQSIFLEQKIKHHVNIHKIRTNITRDQYHQLISRRIVDLHINNSKPHLQQIAGYIRRRQMRPGFLVQYHRQPYVSATYPRFRITFDTNLRSCRGHTLLQHDTWEPYHGYEAVMELKYDTFLPAWIMRVLTSFNLARNDFSKFALGLENLHRFNPLPR